MMTWTRIFWQAAGFGASGDALNDDDVDTLRSLRTALDSGLPEPSLIELVRVYADALRRVAEAEIRLFHFHVHERLHVAEAAGLSDVPGVAGTMSAAIVFVDLARFTPLTEVMGDAVAAEVIDRFSSIVRPAVAG